MLSSNHTILVLKDTVAAAFSYTVCHHVNARIIIHTTGLCDTLLLRKLQHISIGLVVMLCWPLFSSGYSGAVLAGLPPGAFIANGFLRRKNVDEHVKGLKDRYPDLWDIINAATGYGLGILLVTVIYWRSPVAIGTISNLCAGDGVADIVGRRLGTWKLPYNKKKSFAGSVAMAVAGFLASLGYMYYLSWFGYIKESSNMVLGFLVVSIASALVESHPLSTKYDDNWTVPLAATLVGTLVL